jgi:CRP-like cAMP-binding protein
MQISSPFKAKQVLFKEGQPANTVYVVKSGEVLCLKQSQGRLIPVFKACAGDTVGEQAMLEGETYNYYAVTLTYCELETTGTSKFTADFKKSAAWLRELVKTMVDRFEHTADLVSENRIISTDILSASVYTEEVFTPQMENELKKLLGV